MDTRNENENINDFNYQNIEVKKMTGGSKIVRKVSIKNGKGYKSVIKYRKGKKTGTIKKLIHKAQMSNIDRENTKHIINNFDDEMVKEIKSLEMEQL